MRFRRKSSDFEDGDDLVGHHYKQVTRYRDHYRFLHGHSSRFKWQSRLYVDLINDISKLRLPLLHNAFLVLNWLRAHRHLQRMDSLRRVAAGVCLTRTVIASDFFLARASLLTNELVIASSPAIYQPPPPYYCILLRRSGLRNSRMSYPLPFS